MHNVQNTKSSKTRREQMMTSSVPTDRCFKFAFDLHSGFPQLPAQPHVDGTMFDCGGDCRSLSRGFFRVVFSSVADAAATEDRAPPCAGRPCAGRPCASWSRSPPCAGRPSAGIRKQACGLPSSSRGTEKLTTLPAAKPPISMSGRSGSTPYCSRSSSQWTKLCPLSE